jgi:hypothetical protein
MVAGGVEEGAEDGIEPGVAEQPVFLALSAAGVRNVPAVSIGQGRDERRVTTKTVKAGPHRDGSPAHKGGDPL